MTDYDFDYDYGNGSGSGDGSDTGTRRVLTDISSRVWEHPADRAALAALRKLPMFDQVLRALFGFFGEKPIRLAFQANAVQVGPNQFPRIWELYCEVCDTLDAPTRYPLFVSQNPVVNAGAYGMKEPFIILNSGSLVLLTDEQVSYVLGHEVGHVMSDHVLYKTMTQLLIQLSNWASRSWDSPPARSSSGCWNGIARASCRRTGRDCSRSRIRRSSCRRC